MRRAWPFLPSCVCACATASCSLRAAQGPHPSLDQYCLRPHRDVPGHCRRRPLSLPACLAGHDSVRFAFRFLNFCAHAHVLVCYMQSCGACSREVLQPVLSDEERFCVNDARTASVSRLASNAYPPGFLALGPTGTATFIHFVLFIDHVCWSCVCRALLPP